MSYAIQKRPKNRKPLFVAALVVSALVLCGIAGYFYWHQTHPASKKVVINNGGTAIANPNVPNDTNTTSNPSTGSSGSKDEDTDTPGTPGNGSTPATPTGQFISNHRPNLSGSPAPNTETSTCTTSPGATCSITFTKDGMTKSLTAQKTNANGTTVWTDWSLQDIGLTQGTWQVRAVATNAGKQTSATDVMDLVVGS